MEKTYFPVVGDRVLVIEFSGWGPYVYESTLQSNDNKEWPFKDHKGKKFNSLGYDRELGDEVIGAPNLFKLPDNPELKEGKEMYFSKTGGEGNTRPCWTLGKLLYHSPKTGIYYELKDDGTIDNWKCAWDKDVYENRFKK